MELSNDFKEFLKNTEINFIHRNRESVSLNDLFVYPDLRIIKESLEELPTNVLSEKLWDHGERILILGDEQSGKTSLAKSLFLDALSSGFIPLLIQGPNMRNSKIEEQIPKLISTTYNFISTEEFLQKANLVCIVDDTADFK